MEGWQVRWSGAKVDLTVLDDGGERRRTVVIVLLQRFQPSETFALMYTTTTSHDVVKPLRHQLSISCPDHEKITDYSNE